MQIRHARQVIFTTLLVSWGLAAHAGRPLATDDAATAEQGRCQIESWVTGSGSQHALTLAPACGVAPGVELGADYTRSRPRASADDAASLALKWAPGSATLKTGLGELAFGLKLGTSFARPGGESWTGSGSSLLGLASLTLTPEWALHLNLGAAHDRAAGSNASLTQLALVWTPIEQGLVFVEAQDNSRHQVFGGMTRSAGARWWLQKDRLGLDLTTHRQTGAGTSWSLGLGWYGIGL